MNIELVRKEDTTYYRKLVEHHTKYKEIHGEDKTILMLHGEHVSLHRRLRRESKCNIPPDKLNKISIQAYKRKVRDFRKEIDKRVKKRVLDIKS